jgi:hypothetical protein
MIEKWYKSSEVDSSTLDDFVKDPWVTVDSSFIEAIAYFPLAWVMEVRMKNGKRYTFMNVPPEVHKAFMESPSKGNFFNVIVRRYYTKSSQSNPA